MLQLRWLPLSAMPLRKIRSHQPFLAFPLVPVSSSQAIVGSVIGIGLIKGGRGIRRRVLGEIGMAWVATPIAAVFIANLLSGNLRVIEGVAVNQAPQAPTVFPENRKPLICSYSAPRGVGRYMITILRQPLQAAASAMEDACFCAAAYWRAAPSLFCWELMTSAGTNSIALTSQNFTHWGSPPHRSHLNTLCVVRL